MTRWMPLDACGGDCINFNWSSQIAPGDYRETCEHIETRGWILPELNGVDEFPEWCPLKEIIE
jgi:hypothetical protein